MTEKELEDLLVRLGRERREDAMREYLKLKMDGRRN